ncbi:MAG TPA: pilin [Candidatus Saccharimonadales bacterium]|nr:pilin [Candidatus Saccharimonadales bacterium]
MKYKNVLSNVRAALAGAVLIVVAVAATASMAYATNTVECPDGTSVPMPAGASYTQVCADHLNSKGTNDPLADPGVECKGGDCLFTKYFNPAINLLSGLVGVAVVFSIVMGGIQYSASAGDPQKAAKAKSHIYNAVIALVAFAFLFAFLQWIVPGGLLNKH